MAIARRIINEMNRTTDAGLMKVWKNALKELGQPWYYDTYLEEYKLSDGYTQSELARMGAR